MKTKEEIKAYRAAWRAANKEKLKAEGARRYSTQAYKEARAAWRVANKEKIAAQSRAYNAAHKEEIKKYHQDHRCSHRELQSVRFHHRAIFNPKDKSHKNYIGMPFFDLWNPDKGGSFKAGEKWIVENLGKRPEGSTLHVVAHEKGFTPDNLEWAHPRKQVHQQMHKIIAQQKHRIKELEEQIEILKRRTR